LHQDWHLEKRVDTGEERNTFSIIMCPVMDKTQFVATRHIGVQPVAGGKTPYGRGLSCTRCTRCQRSSAAVLDQWYEPSATYFKVQSIEGKTYLLRDNEQTDDWTLQSGFDGDELLARPDIEFVTVDPATTEEAEQLIESCEYCHPDDAEIPFDWILADVTGKRGAYEFMLSEPARCPNCKHEITEKTLVEPKD
jgi:hypothetical protein